MKGRRRREEEQKGGAMEKRAREEHGTSLLAIRGPKGHRNRQARGATGRVLLR